MTSTLRQAARSFGPAFVLLVSMGACDSSGNRTEIGPVTTPTSPSSTSPLPQPVADTFTGTVFEFTSSGDRLPVPNLRLRIRTGSGGGGAVGGVELSEVVTDSNGRYQIAGVTSPSLLFVTTAPGSDHRTLCQYHPLHVDLRPDRPPSPAGDIPVVHNSWSGDRLPPGMWIAGTSVYGTVSERVDGALRPLVDATVTLDNGMQDPPATTSPTGFYMVCSTVGTDQFRTISARKDGYKITTRQIFGGWEPHVDLELTRD
jgi:hypothetical protein